MNALPGIENFAEVEPNIYRGGQPTDEGWNALKAAGVAIIIKLNTAAEAQDVAAAALGMGVVYQPIDTAEQILFKPKRESVLTATSLIFPNTFIHCEHGQDRTGLIVGCYRVQFEGWKKEAAWKEMLDHGFHPELLGLTLFWEWCV